LATLVTMSGTESAETEKKKPAGLVRLGQNGRKKTSTPGSPMALGGAGATPRSFGTTHTTFKAQRDLSLGAKTLTSSPRPLSATKPLQAASAVRSPTARLLPANSPAAARKPVTTAKVTDRKKFVPNLNVQRQVKKEEAVTEVKGEKGGGNRRNRENKHARKEKNSRDRPTLIQTGSIFSEGIAGDGGIRRRFGGSGGGGGGGRGEATELTRPKLELNQTIDREAEERRLKDILRDDFIDDLKSGSYVPVQLPMIDTGKMFKAEAKKVETCEDDIKPKLLSKKRNVIESDDDDEDEAAAIEDSKPVIDEPAVATVPAREPTAGQLLTQQTGELVFFQLPDCLPLVEPETSLEGQLGRLEVRRSGRCQLVLDNKRMDVEAGTKVGFLQDAVSVRVPGGDRHDGQLTVLGHVAHRLIVSPDWNSLLEQAGLNQNLA